MASGAASNNSWLEEQHKWVGLIIVSLMQHGATTVYEDPAPFFASMRCLNKLIGGGGEVGCAPSSSAGAALGGTGDCWGSWDCCWD